MDEISYTFLTEFLEYEPLSIKEICNVFHMSLESTAEYVNYLRKQGYLQITGRAANRYSANYDGPLSINDQLKVTARGKIELNSFRQASKSDFWKEFRAWVTLAIAVAAFIKSFFIQ